ncbi:YgiQ family radical SAM protein [candidate division KSB1 bacterium]|nr:YgiQ family radical SAM protein [candidate division KSB1 bacterium]RQW01346.1 MAG: YgiQ family radical SAM protein [candidate division KSB1 bacterium]
MFLPTTRNELEKLGWERCDVIFVTGDSYIDSPTHGAALLGKWLHRHGFRVGIIAQPDIQSPGDITRLGEPALFWGVTGGNVDSMVANYTALNKKRRQDDYTPGGVNNRRPDRAVIVYSNLIRRYFKHTVPIVLGGIEASLRRIAHYDFWSNRVRRSILFDAKADFLVFGMGERAVIDMAQRLQRGDRLENVRGICTISKEARQDYLQLPSFEASASDKRTFIEMFRLFYENNDPKTAQGLRQKHGDRWLEQNPPADPLGIKELDDVYSLEFELEAHPFYRQQGHIRALDTIRFSITTHRGCYGECNFCAITVHQGRTIQSRSEASILAEAYRMTRHPRFTGIISDVGGPTANMYGYDCPRKVTTGACTDKRCLAFHMCQSLKPSHKAQINLLRKIRGLTGVKKVFVSSGIRYDLIECDEEFGDAYVQEIVEFHVSGQLKVAPEHSEEHVLKLMGKPAVESLRQFKKKFDEKSKKAGKQQFLTYYFIAAHPGCTERDMDKLKQFVRRDLKMNPEQVQIFTPAPGTWASVMYYTEIDPFTGRKIFVEKNPKKKEWQKWIVTRKNTL